MIDFVSASLLTEGLLTLEGARISLVGDGRPSFLILASFFVFLICFYHRLSCFISKIPHKKRPRGLYRTSDRFCLLGLYCFILRY